MALAVLRVHTRHTRLETGAPIIAALGAAAVVAIDTIRITTTPPPPI